MRRDHHVARGVAPPLLLAYGWAWAFSVFAATAGLSASQRGPIPLSVPVLIFGFGFIVAVVLALRTFLLDMTADLGVRESLALFLLHALFFMAPQFAWSSRATLIDSLVALQLPLLALLLRRSNFLRLYLVNFILVALAAFLHWQTGRRGFEWAVPAPAFLIFCFTADRFFFQTQRYPETGTQPVGLPLWLGAKYAAVSLAGGALLYAITPSFATIPRAAPARPVVEYPDGAVNISTESLVALLWDAFLLMVMIVVALLAVRWIRKKFHRVAENGAVEMSGKARQMVPKPVPAPPRQPDGPRGFSPREQILRAYWAWCDDMERFGLRRMESATAKEFARDVTRGHDTVVPMVEQLTRLFESAKYSTRNLAAADAETFLDQSRRALDILIDSVEKDGR